MSRLSGILPSASTRHSALSVLCLPVHPTYMLPSSSKAGSDLHNHAPCTRKFPSVTSLPQLVPCPLKKQDARTHYSVPPPLPGSNRHGLSGATKSGVSPGLGMPQDTPRTHGLASPVYVWCLLPIRVIRDPHILSPEV